MTGPFCTPAVFGGAVLNSPVPNKFPTLSSNKRVALIGEAPGSEEVKQGQPFVGASGRFLAALLSRAGIPYESCFLGNICQYQPPGNDFHFFKWDDPLVLESRYQLAKDLVQFNPNIIVLLGNIPLKAAKDNATPLTKKARFSNSQWRGSLFMCDQPGPFTGRKCLSTLHPAYCLRDYDTAPLLQLDLYKAARHASSPELVLPKRTLFIPTDADEVVLNLDKIRTEHTHIALDIEGGIDSMSCISIAIDADKSFTIPFSRKDGSSYWTDIDENKIWRALSELLEDPTVPKILQNSLYDRFVLHFSYGIRVCGVREDTMLKFWELYSELEKGLAVQASIMTDEPFYKGDRKSHDDKTFYEYCARDSAVTYELCGKQDLAFIGHEQWKHARTVQERWLIREHYGLNVELLNPLLYMEVKGIKYSTNLASLRRGALRTKMFEAQARLNGLTGYGFHWNNWKEIHDCAHAAMLTKKKDRAFKDEEANWKQFNYLIGYQNPDLSTMGEVEDLCGVSLNVDSNKQLIAYLYEELKLPVQYSPKVKGEEPHPTVDYEALLRLSRECQKTPNDPRLPIIQTIIELRALITRQKMLSISADRDGRIRCGYNIVGTNTGRITCYESPTGSGYNLQTIPNYTIPSEAPGGVVGDRDLFVADEGFHMFQCDLSGADGWTVAAYCAMLGDPTMLADYKAGVSPFKILTLILRGLKVPNDRNELREAVKVIEKDSWDRFAMKRVQHGGAYLEGGVTISRNILKDSEGKLYIPPNECDRIKEHVYFGRYPGIRRWHNWVASRLKERPILVAASGQVRQFFGRPDDRLTKAVAFEPQSNTTWTTNLALHKLWHDNENRTTDNRLFIQPLHTVHDALVGQFPKEKTEWALSKIRSYFNNTITVAGQSFVIPFEGNYGDSWGTLEEGKV